MKQSDQRDGGISLKENIQKALKRGSASYLNGVLQVERKLGKNKKRIEWLENKIKGMRHNGA